MSENIDYGRDATDSLGGCIPQLRHYDPTLDACVRAFGMQKQILLYSALSKQVARPRVDISSRRCMQQSERA